MLAASARLFIRTTRATAVTKYFVIIPSSLLLVSLLSVTVSDVLADLSLPAALVLHTSRSPRSSRPTSMTSGPAAGPLRHAN